ITDYTSMTVQLREDTAICHGTSMRFLSEVSGGFPPYTYHWNYGNDNDSLLIVTLPVGHDTVISTVKDICPNDVSDQTLVTVHPVPVANAGQNVSIPNGTSTSLTGSANGGYGTYSYYWESNPAGFTSTQQNPNTGNLYNTTIFRLTVTDLTSGCVSEPSQVIVAVAGGVLSTNPAAEPPAVCKGQPSTLYALPGGGSGLYTYAWTSDPPGMTSDQPSVVVSPLQTTTYHITVNDGFNNVYGTTSLTIYPPPVIHLGPLDSTVCIYDSIRLDAGNPGAAYLWSNGADTRTITIASAGLAFEVQTYQVVVTNENGCQDSALINVIFSFNDCVGVQEQQEFKDFNIYPNPNDGTFHLTMRSRDERVWIHIYDMNGRKVYNEMMDTAPGKETSKDIILPDSPPGIYLLQVSGINYSGTKRILIKR
ncbi:MAG: T9SS type A sorting domain-containing protein, partial [Syntrophothermus sp.]